VFEHPLREGEIEYRREEDEEGKEEKGEVRGLRADVIARRLDARLSSYPMNLNLTP